MAQRRGRDAHSRQFKQYHFVPAVLKNRASYGQDYTFQFVRNPFLMLGLLPGDAVRVFYAPSAIGTMNAMEINYSGERTDTGTVVQVGVSGTSLTLMSKSGVIKTYQTGGNLALTQQLALGDVASVAYTTTPGVNVTDGAFVARASTAPPVTTAHSVQLKAAAGPAQVSGTVIALSAGGASFKLHTASGTNQTFATAGGESDVHDGGQQRGFCANTFGWATRSRSRSFRRMGVFRSLRRCRWHQRRRRAVGRRKRPRPLPLRPGRRRSRVSS